jgi:hypothetical protein
VLSLLLNLPYNNISLGKLAREEWGKGPGSPPVVKGLVWYTDGPRTRGGGGAGAGVFGNFLGRRLSISVGKYVTVFQAERYMLSWPVFTKFRLMLDQRNTLVFGLIVKQL